MSARMIGSIRILGLRFCRLAAILSLLAATACSPGRYLASRFLKAPNTYPTWIEPSPRVVFDYDRKLATGLPTRTVAVGPPPAALHVVLVEPADYSLLIDSVNRRHGRKEQMTLSLRVQMPGAPLPASRRPKGTVVILHGYGVDLDSMLPWGLIVAEAGYRAALVDLRGHGQSTGRRIYFGAVETGDLRELLDQLMRSGAANEPVAVMGESFGAALALRWAADDPRVRAVVAMAPYAEFRAAALGLRDEYVRWLPASWARSIAYWLPRLLAVPPDGLDTTPYVERLRAATFFIAAGHDPISPAPTVARLARLAPGPAKYRAVLSARHETLPYQFDELRTAVLDWLDAYCR